MVLFFKHMHNFHLNIHNHNNLTIFLYNWFNQLLAYFRLNDWMIWIKFCKNLILQ